MVIALYPRQTGSYDAEEIETLTESAKVHIFGAYVRRKAQLVFSAAVNIRHELQKRRLEVSKIQSMSRTITSDYSAEHEAPAHTPVSRVD